MTDLPAFPSAAYLPAWPFHSTSVSVTEQTVLGLPAAWRALRLIADTAAACAPKVFDGFAVIEGTFVDRPNSMMTPAEWYSESVAQAVMHGDSIHYIVRGEDGYCEQLIPLPTTEVYGRYNESGWPEYRFRDQTFGRDEILHVRGFTIPGQLMGIGVVEAHMRGLGIAIDQQNFASSSIRTGGVPSAVIQMPVNAKDFTKERAEEIQESWIESHARGQRKPAIVPRDMTVTPLSWKPEEMEFLESRRFSVAEVALMFGLQPEDLSASIGGPSMTYSNAETREQARLKDIAPWLLRFEQRLTDLLPRGEVKFTFEKILRADTKSRYEAHKLGLDGGWLTIEDVRRIEGLPPLNQGQAA